MRRPKTLSAQMADKDIHVQMTVVGLDRQWAENRECRRNLGSSGREDGNFRKCEI
jgi:hypothetical protein